MSNGRHLWRRSVPPSHHLTNVDWINSSTVMAVETSPRLSQCYSYSGIPLVGDEALGALLGPRLQLAWLILRTVSCMRFAEILYCNMYKMSLHFAYYSTELFTVCVRQGQTRVRDNTLRRLTFPSARKQPAKETGECRPSGP